MNFFIILFVLIFSLISGIFFYFKRSFSYWKRHGIPYIEPDFPDGILFKSFKKKKHMTLIIRECYFDLKKKNVGFAGIYFFTNPMALLLDLDLIKRVMVKDFHSFQDRGIYHNEKDDPLSAHLFSLDGPKWRRLRVKLSPTFTSGKMKSMFHIVIGVAEQFKKAIERETAGNVEIEIRDILARFGTDIIGSCAFGLECSSLDNPDTEFRVVGKRIFDVSTKERLKQLFVISLGDISKKLGLKITPDSVTKFFLKVVEDTVRYREENDVRRGDFMDLLIALKNETSQDGEAPLTLNEIAAQAFVFFIAGFETSSTTMTFCLFELARNPEIQEKARKSVLQALERHDGKITYDSILEMTYLDQCINETLRYYPPVPGLIRRANKDYYVPEIDYTIKKKQTVLISAFSIHHDPEYWPNPEVFDPDRFLPEEVEKRHPMAFLPFGEGNRNCIGMRFGYMQVRVGLATILANFRLTLSEKTQVPIKFSLRNPLLSAEGGIWLKFEKIAK